jgi:membrane-associated protease RseP (regulator of RpoE activity)
VLLVDGKEMSSPNEINREIFLRDARSLTVQHPDGSKETVKLPEDFGQTLFQEGAMQLFSLRHKSTTIDSVVPSSPAAKSGLKKGDLITAVGNSKVEFFDEIQSGLFSNKNKEIVIAVVRNSDTVNVKAKVKEDGTIGFMPKSVGYIDSASGEFKTVALNNGQRDTLYELKINPIPFFVGVGHIAFGQKTRARNASALDRINVARLIVYLRSQLTKLARPYLFEPNDKQTRDEIKGAVESLLIELVGLRALYDFAVVCDESNNTPARIDRNELWLDIAIEPTKAVEFIYIPLRIKNTGEI